MSPSRTHQESPNNQLIPLAKIELMIHLVRGQRVIFDEDLASLYGVTTKRLNEQVRRNRLRFPSDFMFKINEKEYASLRSQNATSNKALRGGRRYLPFVFTEHGAIMAASVLNSQEAVEMSLFVVRAFVRLRGLLAQHQELAKKIEDLENKYDHKFKMVFEAIRELMNVPEQGTPKIGFKVERDS